MKRKNFLKTIGIASAASIIKPTFGNNFSTSAIEKIKPNRLRKGDTIGLIAPAGFLSEEEVEDAIKNLETLGYKVVKGKNLLQRSGYLAGSDKQRAEDVNEMFADKNIHGIFCARGGYGCARLLHLLDYQTIKNNPKVIIGYSDVTSLLYGIFSQTGLICFHGPVGTSTFNEFSVQNFFATVMNPETSYNFYNAEPEKEKGEQNIYTIRSGKAAGKLVGGNLSIVASMVGTKYDVDTKDSIIFLEEIREEPYRVDRMLTQMIQAGKFGNASAVMLGIFTRCEAKEDSGGTSSSFSLSEVLIDRLYDLGIPVIYGMSFGHVMNKFTIPFGCNAALDVDNQTFKLLEPPVI